MTLGETPIETPPQAKEQPKERRILRALLLVLALACLAFALFGVPPSLETGQAAPALQLRSYDGQSWTIDRYKGQAMVLNFWATWCAPCLHEIPAFTDVARKNPDIVFVGAAVQSPPEEVLAVVRKMNIPYLIAEASDRGAQAYGARALPTTVFLDEDHQVVFAQSGAMSKQRLLGLMKKHLR